MQLSKSDETKTVIPEQFVDGKMQFKIRAYNKCGIPSSFSRTLILTITKSGGPAPRERNCDGQSTTTKRSRPKPKVDDYESRLANARHYFWADLLAKKSKVAAEAVKWAFPDRGRESDMIKAEKVLAEQLAKVFAEQEKQNRKDMQMEKKKLA